jgi:hypothetical protein
MRVAQLAWQRRSDCWINVGAHNFRWARVSRSSRRLVIIEDTELLQRSSKFKLLELLVDLYRVTD